MQHGAFIEFAHGKEVNEEDIIRYEDDYGRTLHSEKLVMVSGGFDPLHVGHLEMLEEAKKLGDRLVVVLNCDEWLVRKKGRRLMQEEDRAALVKGLKFVDDVYVLKTDRDDVGEAIEKFKPHIFANGGDRKDETSIPEASICKKFGVEMVFNVGKRGKIRSSSELLDDYAKRVGKKTTTGDFSWQEGMK